MQTNEYQHNASLTEAPYPGVKDDDIISRRLLHAAMGLCTEAGEFTDAMKREIFYGKPVDFTNLVEEIGDVLWYVALACNALGVDMSEVMDKNIAKLRTRYPEKFTEQDAINRDLDAEREALEGGTDESDDA